MGILDEAIREHLELKRQHGADDSELKEIEDQAFGPAERPGSEDSGSDTAAEAPTEFMAQPEQGTELGETTPEERPPVRREPAAGMADIQEPPEAPAAEAPPEEETEPVAETPEPAEEQPAAEHEAVPAPEAGPSTEERHAIADQPTEMYDVEEGFEAPSGGDVSDEDLAAEEVTEPRLGPAVPDADEEDEGEDDFFDEKRLSDELDQALEAPPEPEPEVEPEPIEEEPELIEEEPEAHEEELEAHEEPESEEHEVEEERRSDADVLGETPDFLEESPEDDELWFEQKPPKDFDFDD
jgi:hypothetical protein